MGASEFAFGPTHVRVIAPDAPLAWLCHFLRPWFSGTGGGPGRLVELRIDPGAYGRVATSSRATVETRDCFLLDARIVRHALVDRSDGREWVADAELSVVYGVHEDGSVLVLAAFDGPGTRVALMRVVREMALTDAHGHGHPVLHAAVVDESGAALAICGAKRAGKTSMLLHLLAAPGRGFVANDRAVAWQAAAGWRVRGLPTITALRATTLDHFREVARRLRTAPDRHWQAPGEAVAGSTPWADPSRSVDLAPRQLCALLDVTAVPESTLRTLLFPRIDPAATGIVERSLSQDETLARLQRAQVGVDHRAAYVPLFAAPDPDRHLAAASASTDDALESLASLAAFEVRLGPLAYQQPAPR